MTVEGGQPAKAVDPQASLRTELTGQLAAAQLALEAAIAELSRNGADSATLAATRLQLSSLISLRQQVGAATGSALAELRAEVSAVAASASAMAQQTGGASNSSAADATTRAAAARQTIEKVGREIFEEKVLDPYLQFASKADEEAYRKREQERKEEFNKAMALGTPEGYRTALQIQQQQIRDAGAHGANRSPDFPQIQSDLARASADLASLHIDTKETPTKREVSAKAKSATDGELDEVLATLNAAGVTTTEKVSAHSPHGLAERAIATRGQGQSPSRA